MLDIDWDELLAAARMARSRAYAPYSNFKVGAALLAPSGQMFTGCNVENASYGLTVCAERNAVGQAVTGGVTRIIAAAIVAGDTPCPPCGACRQVLAEFGKPDMLVLMAAGRTRLIRRLDELLPDSFGRRDLAGRK